MHYCLRHMEEPAAAECRSCHGTFCNRCLVFSFGPKKPPYCVGCALHASGVRSGSRRVSLPPAPLGIDPIMEPVAPAVATASAERRPTRADRRADRQAKKEATRAARRGGLPVAPEATQSSAPLDFEPMADLALAPSQLQLSGPLPAGAFTDL